MFLFRHAVLAGLVLFLTPPLYAAPLTLQELVGAAHQNNPFAQVYRAREEESRWAAAGAGQLPGASIDLLGPRWEAAVRQPLPLLGKERLNAELLRGESASWKAQGALAQDELTRRIILAGYRYATLQRNAAFADDRQKRFELLQSYIAGRTFVSPQRKVEIHIVRNRLKSLQTDVIDTHSEARATLAELRLLIPTLPADAEISPPWLTGARTLPSVEMSAKATQNNPEVIEHQRAADAARLGERLAARGQWPDPTLLASYEHAKAAETERNLRLGLGFSFASWNGNQAARRSLSQRKLAEDNLLVAQRLSVAAELAYALEAYEAARQKVVAYPRSMLDELQHQLRETETGFRKGQVDLLTFLELDASVAEAFARVTDGQVALVTALSEVWRLTGEHDALSQLGSY